MYPSPNYQTVTVEIFHDEDMARNDYEEMIGGAMGYRFVSFNTRHANFLDPSEVPDGSIPLSYYEHGFSLWSPAGTGPKCDFDSVSYAGAIIVDDGEDTSWLTDDVVKNLCEVFTDACNGTNFYFVQVGDDGFSCHDTPCVEEVRSLFPEGAIKSVKVVNPDGMADYATDEISRKLLDKVA